MGMAVISMIYRTKKMRNEEGLNLGSFALQISCLVLYYHREY